MFRLLALVALLVVLAAACESGGAEEEVSGNGGNSAPEGLSLVVYKETLSNIVYAEQLPKQRYWQFTAETDKDFLQAMSCTPDGRHAAYLMQSIDGGVRLKISGRPEPIPVSGQSSGLTWAPDGSKIAVTTFDPTSSANQLQIFDAESGQGSIVASGRGAIGPPRWSPDGTRIVFDASDGQVTRIFVYTIGGQDASKLNDRPDNAFGPDWSPDGARLIFAALGPGEIHQIYSVSADGSNETQITTSNVTKAFPRWAPDGSLIAFAGTVVVPAAAERPALVHNLAVFAVKPDGSGEQAITDLASDARLGGWCVSGPWLNEDWKVSS